MSTIKFSIYLHDTYERDTIGQLQSPQWIHLSLCMCSRRKMEIKQGAF